MVLMCVTINDRTALKITNVGLKLHHPKRVGELNPMVGWAGLLPIIKLLPTDAAFACDNVLWYKSKLKHFIK
jgi:hypothetical protein